MTVVACYAGAEWEVTKSGRGRYTESHLEHFLERDMLRQASWLFIAYGWILVGGFAISLSHLILRES